MTLRVVLEPSDEGGFTVYVPALPGCVSDGDSEQDALANIREAVELCLEDNEARRLPPGKPVLVRELAL